MFYLKYAKVLPNVKKLVIVAVLIEQRYNESL